MEAYLSHVLLAAILALALHLCFSLLPDRYSNLCEVIDCIVLSVSLAKLISKRTNMQQHVSVPGEFNAILRPLIAVLTAFGLMLMGRIVDWSPLRTALAISLTWTMSATCVVSKRAQSVQTGPEPLFRLRSNSATFDDQSMLDLLEQGYFLCSRPKVEGMGTFVVLMTNSRANEILQSLRMSYDELADRLVEFDAPYRTLRVAIESALKDDVPCGPVTKLYLRPNAPRRGDSNPNTAYRDLSERFSRSVSGQGTDSIKACPLSNYKAKIVKPRKGTIILILSEHNMTSSLVMTETLTATIVCTLSHEIKTFLNCIVGNLELLRDGIHTITSKTCHKIATCSAILLVNKLNDLFDYLVLNNKEFKLHCSEFDLSDLLKEVTKACGPLAEQRQIKFKITRIPPMSNRIFGDRTRILQLILSVVCKSIEFSDYATTVQLLVKRTKCNHVSFRVRSYGLSMQSKVEQHLRNLSSGDRARGRVPSGDSPIEATQNLEALALQISQLICKKMGTNLVMKVVREEYVEMKFAVKDGFPSPVLHFAGSPNEKQRRFSSNLKDDCEMQKGQPSKFCHCSSRNSLASEDADCAVRVITTPEKDEPNMFAGLAKNLLGRPAVENTIQEEGKRKSASPERDNIPSELCTDGVFIPTTPRKRLMKSAGLTSGSLVNVLRSTTMAECGTPKLRTRRTTIIETILEDQELPARSLDDTGVCRVLVVDDNTFNRYVLKGLLRKHGANSIEASDGSEAVQIVERYIKAHKLSELSLIVMDLQMPVMNGIEATRAIRMRCREAKCSGPHIVGVSADSNEEDRRKFMRAGLDEFLPRPVDSKKIKTILFKYVRR